MYCKLAPPLKMNCPSASDRLRYYRLAFRVFSHIRVSKARSSLHTGNGSDATGCDNMRDTTEATWKQPAHTVGLRVVACAALDTTAHYCLRLMLLSPDPEQPIRPLSDRRCGAPHARRRSASRRAPAGGGRKQLIICTF